VILCSAASLDLCLHVVQRDYGTEIASWLARDLVVPLHRDGGQAQFIETPMPAPDEAGLFAGTVAWVRAHLYETVTVRDLAARAAMSPRTFARRFVAGTGATPYQWIVRERVRLAQRLLEPAICRWRPSRARAASPRPTICASTSAACCGRARRPTGILPVPVARVTELTVRRLRHRMLFWFLLPPNDPLGI